MRSLTKLESRLLCLASPNHKNGWRSKKTDGAVQHHALWDAHCIRHAHRYAFRKRIGGC